MSLTVEEIFRNGAKRQAAHVTIDEALIEREVKWLAGNGEYFVSELLRRMWNDSVRQRAITNGSH